MSVVKRINGVAITLIFLLLSACSVQEQPQRQGKKIQVITTLFPLYDMARALGGKFCEVILLLPPGAEAHTYEPRPGDLLRLNKADIFIYTGSAMEPWAASILKSLDNKRLTVINAGAGISLSKQGRSVDHDDRHDHRTGDPHIWLDFGNAQTMMTTILSAFIAKDPANANTYQQNAAVYRARLEKLDHTYRRGLADCDARTIVHGGHYAFGYLAKRYDLRYVAALPATGDGEPNARQMASMVNLIRAAKVHAVFYEEMVSPGLADTLARETQTQLLALNTAHNVTREQLARGVTFSELMDQNLENLRKGLRCR